MACLTQDIAIFPPIPHQYFRADDLELKSVFTCPEINFGRGPSENELPIPRTCDQKCQKIFRIFLKKLEPKNFIKLQRCQYNKIRKIQNFGNSQKNRNQRVRLSKSLKSDIFKKNVIFVFLHIIFLTFVYIPGSKIF